MDADLREPHGSHPDRLDVLLHRSDPLPAAALDTAEVHDAITALLAQTRRQTDGVVVPLTPLSSGRRVRRAQGRALRAAAVTAALVLAGTGAAAAAGFLPMRTGIFGKPGMTENDTTEILNTDSPETRALMERIVGEMPLAPGYDAEPLIERYTTAPNTLIQEAGLRGQVFAWSTCSWQQAWVDAHAAGDAAAQARATAVLTAVPGWPIVHVIDGDGGLTASVEAVAAAAAAGDAGPVQRAAAGCDLTGAR